MTTVERPLRVIQWTTGNIGRRSLHAIIGRDDMELVGVYAHGADKVGVDAAELSGWPEPTGVTATNDIDALLALKPDACCYNPLWPNIDELTRLLESGVNVCSSAAWITGGKQSPEDLERIRKACEKGNSTIFGSGAHPGMTNLVGMVLSGSCERVDEIRITESVDCSTYESAGTQTAMGFSQDPDTPGLAESVRRESEVFAESAAMMADAIGARLDKMTFDVTFTPATGDTDLGFMQIPKGTVAGVYGYHRGWVGDRNVVSVGFNWIMGDHVTPPKPLEHGHVIQVFGLPNMSLRWTPCRQRFISDSPRTATATCSPSIDSARIVRSCARKSGWVTTEYMDNDTSASNGKTRPDYQRMLADIRDGRIDAVVAWDLDRLYRQPRELEDLIDLADQKHLALATVGGEADLSTDNGRLFARIKGAVAKSETDRKSARQKRADQQRAEAGTPEPLHGAVRLPASRRCARARARRGDDGPRRLQRDPGRRQPARDRQGSGTPPTCRPGAATGGLAPPCDSCCMCMAQRRRRGLQGRAGRRGRLAADRGPRRLRRACGPS